MNLEHYFLLIVNIICFFLGYNLGYLKNYKRHYDSQDHNRSFEKIKNSNNNTSAINIDETKVVIPIQIEGLEKKYDMLGDTIKSNENINNLVNKLKDFKK